VLRSAVLLLVDGVIVKTSRLIERIANAFGGTPVRTGLPPFDQWDLPTLARHRRELETGDSVALAYLLPAAMMAQLRHMAEPDGNHFLHLFTGILCSLSANHPMVLRTWAQERLAWLGVEQRAVIADFCEVALPTEAPSWVRVVAHDASDTDTDWFDVFWPPRVRRPSEELLATCLAAFPTASDTPYEDAEARPSVERYLPFAPDDVLWRRLPASLVFLARYPGDPRSNCVLEEVLEVLRPVARKAGGPPLRRRLERLTVEQRRAVSACIDTWCDEDRIRDVWHEAASGATVDWMEHLSTVTDDNEYKRRWWQEAAYKASQSSNDEPVGLPEPPDLRRDRSEVAVLIEDAFDGVPQPGERTLIDAEEADNLSGEPLGLPEPHRGRWQDVPLSELYACGSAFAHLYSDGVHYYLPALFRAFLWWEESWKKRELPMICDGIEFHISSSYGSSLRSHMRDRMSRFSPEQRAAIAAFLRSRNPDTESAQTWSRVVAHDASGAPGHWLDVFWPDRQRPDSNEVLAELVNAFALGTLDADALAVEASSPVPLLGLDPEAFARVIPRYIAFLLVSPDAPCSSDLLSRVTRALHPRWGARDQPSVRTRLGLLTQQQRRAVSRFADACIERESMRQVWSRAAAHEGDDWFEYLRLP
jgi:hypothetical protein